MSLRRSKLALLAALAATVLTAAPAGAGTEAAALYPCRVVPLLGIEPGRQIVAIAGAYTAPVGATSAVLSCGAVVNGATYASVPDKVPGPLALLAGTGSVPQGTVTSCYTLRVTYLTRPDTYSDTCP